MRGAYLAVMVAAAGWSAAHPAARAQGLVITPLPSDQVIQAVEQPAQVMPATPVAVQPLPIDPGPQPPARAGLPRASVIIGDMAVLAGFDPRGPMGLAFESRRQIRDRDGALFDRLLGDGAFDPDADQLAEAIQTELRRMACYGGNIDGAWGAGSEGAVQRWSQVARAEAGRTPDIALFRTILRGGDLQCPAATPAAVAAPAASSRAAPARDNRANTATSRRSSTPARTTPRQPAQQPATPSRQINPSLMGSGLFR